MNWIYKKKPIESIEDFPEDTFGFVYRVTHIPTGKMYIGKKQLIYHRKTKLGKKELALFEGQKGRKPKYKMVLKESDWKNYYGSSKTLLELISTGDLKDFKREIIILCPTKKLLTYYESQALFTYRVLESDEYFNNDILGKFHRKDFDT